MSSASSIFQSNASSAFAWSLSSSVSFDQPSRLWLPLPHNLLRRAFNFNCNSSITIVSPYENISDYCKVKVHLHVTSSTNQLLYTKLQYQLLPISFYLPSYSINWLIICLLHEVYSCREYEIFSQFVEPCQSVSRLSTRYTNYKTWNSMKVNNKHDTVTLCIQAEGYNTRPDKKAGHQASWSPQVQISASCNRIINYEVKFLELLFELRSVTYIFRYFSYF